MTMQDFWDDGYKSYKDGVAVAAPSLSPYVMEKLKGRSVGDPYTTAAMNRWIEGWHAAAAEAAESGVPDEPPIVDAEVVEPEPSVPDHDGTGPELPPDDPDFHPVDPEQVRTWDDLATSGVLWLINTTVFHPRGFALEILRRQDTMEAVGWTILGDGSAPWLYQEPPINEFKSVQALLAPKEVTDAE